MVNTAQQIGEILVEQGAISPEVYEKIKLESINTDLSQEEIIAQRNLVDSTSLAKAKAKAINVPYVSLAETGIIPEVFQVIPEAVALRFNILPFTLDKTTKILSIAMANPLDLEAIEFIEKKSGLKVKPFIAEPEVIAKLTKERYAKSLSAEVTEALEETVAPAGVKTIDVKTLGEIIHEAPIAKIVATILEFAVKTRASDVHIEPGPGRTRIRYRIDGIMHEKLILPSKVHEAVVSRIKILSGMKIDEKRLPQDGRFNFREEGREVDLRVSCLPTVHGEKIVMRLLEKGGQVPTLTELGLRGHGLKILQRAISQPQGIILMTGPTGSGKTTTLYSILSKLNTPRVNIITLEDPVEYEIKGISQVQVHQKVGLTFSSGLRSFLRQDPDIIMVGEVRDEETTDLAIHAALTGHLVFSTLHTNSAAGAAPRLIDMGAEPFLLASALSCVVAQRIPRRVCQACIEEYAPPAEAVASIKKILGDLMPEKKKITLFRGKKCAKCNQTGYSGRMGIFEVVDVNEKIGRLILERAPSSKIEKQALSDGMLLMIQDGFLKALEGITTIEEVLRVAKTV